jgi:hypothetical protein
MPRGGPFERKGRHPLEIRSGEPSSAAAPRRVGQLSEGQLPVARSEFSCSRFSPRTSHAGSSLSNCRRASPSRLSNHFGRSRQHIRRNRPLIYRTEAPTYVHRHSDLSSCAFAVSRLGFRVLGITRPLASNQTRNRCASSATIWHVSCQLYGESRQHETRCNKSENREIGAALGTAERCAVSLT